MVLEERISIAPMLDWTDPHYRALLRGITRKSVLYTEMVVDETVLHAPNLDFFLGRRTEYEPSVIQLGGSDPDLMAQAAEHCEVYSNGTYQEINVNCGCPSERVAKKCFGAKLMLDPELVREIVSKMQRRVSIPVTVKCRIGVDNNDSYDELKRFIFAAAEGGAKKFIIHSRKCILHGLTTKQNRDIPPLRYEVTHRLVEDFPGLMFVLNGGIQTFEQALTHLSPYQNERCSGPLPPVHGVMIGRMAYNNPVAFATADSTFYGVKDPCLTRRQIIENYIEYCEWCQSEEGPRRCVKGGRVQMVSTMILLNAMRNVICGVRNVSKFRQELNDIYMEKLNEDKNNPNPNPREVVSHLSVFSIYFPHN
jgi:tRNA-dihydrouridine synthase A